jgi:uncharacterized membrane protein YebE (DUF533 family)
MADFKKLLTVVLLADGTIDDKEAKLIGKELLADGKIDNAEVEFLVGLRNAQKSPGKAFEKLFFDALTLNVLADGSIDDKEAKKLRAVLFADGKVDAAEKAFIKNLKKKAKSTSKGFDKLYAEVVG